ncbi:hypothetical protein C5167_046334 [Papaver somniferum]|uniref:Uncharacterized protein n=1 Tax=Papaver somniferum TaxID=3469 RepID=A0A4Y7LG81_PAPSO|nr:hypothetical protein C5167_046334 [Papaver somniferum]
MIVGWTMRLLMDIPEFFETATLFYNSLCCSLFASGEGRALVSFPLAARRMNTLNDLLGRQVTDAKGRSFLDSWRINETSWAELATSDIIWRHHLNKPVLTRPRKAMYSPSKYCWGHDNKMLQKTRRVL